MVECTAWLVGFYLRSSHGQAMMMAYPACLHLIGQIYTGPGFLLPTATFSQLAIFSLTLSVINALLALKLDPSIHHVMRTP